MGRRKTNEEFQEELRQLREQGRDIYSDDMYVGANIKMLFYCLQGHQWKTTYSAIRSGTGCPYCSGRKAIVGINSLWDTRTDIAELLKDPLDGYKYSAGSGQKVYFTCQDCGAEHLKIISNVCKYGFSCSVCGDKISYPAKFSRELLNQICVQNIKYEWSPQWLKPYSYDNYFEYKENKYVLEMDGGLGHGNKQYSSRERDIDGKNRDKYKDSLAEQHGVCVIRVDCDYTGENRFEYIKRSVLNSKLNILFNLSFVDWELCDQKAQKKLLKQAAELYNQGLCLKEIRDILGCSDHSVRRWLNRAKTYGLCDFDSMESYRRSRTFSLRSVNQYTLYGVFINSYVSAVEASEKTKIAYGGIKACCDRIKHHKTAGGYLWFYADDPEQPDQTKIISTIQN